MTSRVTLDRRAPGTDQIYRRMFEAAEVGMVFTSLDGRIRPNPAYCRMLGYTETELQRVAYEDLTHPDDRVESRRRYAAILAGPQHHARWRKRYLRNDGETLWVDISAVLESDGESHPIRFHTVVIDISKRIASEAAAAGANEVLEDEVTERTAELEASRDDLEAFSYSVSHDLRAPLRAMAGFARLLEKKYGSTLDPTATGYIRHIVEGADRMGQMIDALLRFARLGRQQLNRSMVDPSLIALDALDDLHGDVQGREVDIQVAKMPALWADRDLLHHVYLNLLSNALKFTAGKDDARIVVGSAPGPDGATVYSVVDNGAGFDPEYSHKLFGVFQRLHPRDSFEGTGIGLALVRAIVARHGGQVWAAGRVDDGATFSFTVAPPP